MQLFNDINLGFFSSSEQSDGLWNYKNLVNTIDLGLQQCRIFLVSGHSLWVCEMTRSWWHWHRFFSSGFSFCVLKLQELVDVLYGEKYSLVLKRLLLRSSWSHQSSWIIFAQETHRISSHVFSCFSVSQLLCTKIQPIGIWKLIEWKF